MKEAMVDEVMKYHALSIIKKSVLHNIPKYKTKGYSFYIKFTFLCKQWLGAYIFFSLDCFRILGLSEGLVFFTFSLEKDVCWPEICI